MATYDELSKFLDEYESQPQQQQPGADFSMPQQGSGLLAGSTQQPLSPYEQMVRERYGAPEQMQAQNAEQPTFLNSLFRGAAAQGIGTLGGQADFLAGATGSETLRNLGDSAQNLMQEYGRPHEYTAGEIFGNGASGLWKYLSDPNGAAYDIGGGLGSTAAMAAEAAILSAALPSGAATAGAGALATIAGRLGLKSVATALTKGGPAATLIKNVIASTPLEAASESGGTYREMTTDDQGQRLDPDKIDMDKVQEAMAKNFVGNLGVLGASNLLESVGIGRLFGEKMRKGILGKVRNIGEFVATNAGQNAWEEGAQTGTNLYSQGKLDSIGQIVNPLQWNEEQLNAATIGGFAGLGQGGLMGGAGYVGNRMFGNRNQQQETATENIGNEPPDQQYVQPKFTNEVTNRQFGEAVNIAMNDQSGNLVDRMRHLQGHITYDADDGTNCARTVGLALAGTDYQDLINVDDFVRIAEEKGQRHDPANYVPKPGDLAVVNNGNHIVMVSDNGGTIQNGRAGNGVYESELSPQQMFGSVKYYISTSELSSGGRANTQAAQQVNNNEEISAEQQAADETKRRLDAVEEVLTGQPAQDNVQQEAIAGQEQPQAQTEETAEETPEQYINRNFSSLRPINRYQDAFTQDELSVLDKKGRKALKNKFDRYRRNNPTRTLAETYQEMHDFYNSRFGNSTAVTPATNAPQAAPATQQAQPIQNNQQAPAASVMQQAEQPTAQQAEMPPQEEAAVMDSTGGTPAQTASQAPQAEQNNNNIKPVKPSQTRANAPKRTIDSNNPHVIDIVRRAANGDAGAQKALANSGMSAEQQTAIMQANNIVPKGGDQNVSQELPQPETGEGGNQNVNTQLGQSEQKESQNSKTAEKQSEAEVKEAEKSRLVKISNRPAKRIVRKFRKEINGLKATRYDGEETRKKAQEFKRTLQAAVNTNQATPEEARQAVEAIDKAVEKKAENAKLTREERIAKAATGKTVTVMTEDGTKFRVQYKVVEANDVVASNVADGSFAKNPEYPQRLQPRNRQSAVSQATANEMAAKLDPERLTDDRDANKGAPIIDNEGHVENGNLRMMAIMLAHAKENEPARHYEQYLAEHAEDFGLTRSDVESLEHPVLVRERIDNAEGLVEKIISSTTGGQRLSAVEQAKQDAKALTQKTLDKIDVKENGDLNDKFIYAAINDISAKSPYVRNEMVDENGKVSQMGLIRIKNALFAKAYGGDEKLLKLVAESTDNNIKSITGAMMNVAGKVAEIANRMERMDGEENSKLLKADFTKPIIEAAEATEHMRNTGKSLERILQEGPGMFAGQAEDMLPLSQGAKDLLGQLSGSKGSVTGITKTFKEYLRSVEQQNNNEGNLVGTAYDVKTTNPDELVKYWIESTKGGDVFADNSVWEQQPKQEKEKTPAEKHLKAFKDEIKAAVKAMTFDRAKADELLKKYNDSLDKLVERKEATPAEAEANRYVMEDEVKRGFLLNDGRKLLEPKVREWLDANPFVYDKSKSREENAERAREMKQEFIEATGVSDSREIATPARKELQKRIIEYLYNVGIEGRKRERKASLIIGLPASGKSTVSKDLTDNQGYLLVDADEAKQLLPEFHNGVLAGIVHEESSEINKILYKYAIEQGDNICFPTVGGGYDSLKKKIDQLHDAQTENNTKAPYEVTLSFVDVPADEAVTRVLARFEETGRFVDPNNIRASVLKKPEGNVTIKLPEGKRKERLGDTETIPVDNEILKNYLAIKEEKGVEKYEWLDNDLPMDASFGERLRESGELSRPEPAGRHDARNGTDDGRTGERNPGGESSKTTESTQVDRTDTVNQGGSSISESNSSFGVTEGMTGNDVMADLTKMLGVAPKKSAEKTQNKKVNPKPSKKLSVHGANLWKNVYNVVKSFSTQEEFDSAKDYLHRIFSAAERAGVKPAEITSIYNEMMRVIQENAQRKQDMKEAFFDGKGIIRDNLTTADRETVNKVIKGQAKKNDAAKTGKKAITEAKNTEFTGVDTSFNELERLKKELENEMFGKLNANPIFNPKIWSLSCKIGAIYIAKGTRSLRTWAEAMSNYLGEKIRPWLGAIWETLNGYNGSETMDLNTMTAIFEHVGKMQELHPGITKDDFYRLLAEHAGDEKAVRKFKPYIEAAFAGIDEFVTPGETTKVINKALGEIEEKGASNNERPAESVAQNNEQNEEGAELPENTASEDAGRTDTEVVGTGSETAEGMDNGRDQGSAEVRETSGERTGNDNQGLGGNASEDVRETSATGQIGSDSGSTVSSNGSENGRTGETVGSGRDNGLRGVSERESGNREDDASVPGIRDGQGRNGKRGQRIVSEDGSYEILPSGDYHVIDAEKAEFGTTPKDAFKRNALALSIIKRMNEGDDSIEFTPEVKNALANFNGFGRFRNQLFNGTYEHMLPEKGWEKEAEQLKQLMTKEEWEAAQNSTTTAFYTPYGVANAMWNLAKQLGLKHGNILEPSMGVGGFFATMPTDILENSTITGIDIDQNAAKIGEVLYPSAHVFNEGYEDHIVKNNSFDFIVTNVPYENMSMEETPEAKQFSNPNSVLIHDFFFLRGLNQLRPGGVMMALTSTGTMDKQDTQIRLAMAQQAELVGAVRLPNGMFSKSSGTNVACDLLVFRKRETPISRLKASEESWVQTHTMDDGKGKTVFVNNYFAENEGNIVGDMKVTSGQYGPTIKTTFNGTAEEMNAALDKIIKENFPKDIMGKTMTKAESEYTAADTSRANHTFYIKNGKLMYRKDSAEIDIAKDQPVESKQKRPDKLSKLLTTKDAYDDFVGTHPEFKELDFRNSELEGKKKPNNKGYTWKEKADNVASKNQKLAERAIDAVYSERVALDKQQKTEKLIQQVKPLIELNEKVTELVDAMTKGEDKATVEKLRKEALDMFNKAVEATPNKKLAWEVTPMKKDGTPGKTRYEYDEALKVIQNFGDGNAFTTLIALDKGDGKPADILTGIELQSVAKVTEPSVENSLQSQIVDGAQTIDIDKIAKENNKSPDDVLKQLIKDNAVYETLNGDIVPHNVYLSGNVRQKLREAQAMARKDKKFQRNVDALKEVIPEDLTSSEINATIGASWVPVKMYKAFFASLLGLNENTNAVNVVNDNGKWKVEIDDQYNKSDRWRRELAGDDRKSLSDVFNAVMNKRHLKVFDVDGQTHKQTFNQAATDAVEAKIVETNDRFLNWLWNENDERREAMEHMYNETMNCTVNPKFNAEFVKSYPGMIKESIKTVAGKEVKKPFFPFKHQCNVVLKFLTEMRGIAAHDAGTGKTLIMAMLCMEMRRTGKAKKPIIFAHNANSAEIAKNFNKYYPGAKVLYVKELSESANSETTEILLSQMMTGDWDAIVLPHSLMERVAFTEETALKLRQEEIDYWTQRAIAEANENGITLLNNDLEADESHKYNSKTGDSQLDDEEKKRLGSVADYVRKIRTIKKKCKLMGQRLNAPGYIDFEKTGIDCCLIDEAHEFKKGPKDSSRTVKGLDTSSSARGAQMDMLTKFINDRNGNKGVFEFTGTLITNTIPEVHQHMKYVMPDVLKEAGIYHLDDFLSSFTETSTDLEPNAAGEPEAVERLRKFTNIPELRNLAGQHIDIVTVKDLPDFSPRKTESGKTIDDKTLTDEERKYLKNGYDHSAKPEGLPNHEVVNVTVPATRRMDYIYKRIKEIAKWLAEATGVTKKEIFAKGIGLKFQSLVPGIGASIRNLHKNLKDLNTSKADLCVANIRKEYDDAAAQGLPCAQVIFMEKGYNDERTISEAVGQPVKGNKWKKLYTDIYSVAGYNMAKDLQEKLIASGFKPEEVAIAGGDDSKYKKPDERKRLAEKVKKGEVKVVIAEYGTMGVGVNMQDNLRAIHHIDAPWMPGELEQENKRGIRQGNHWNTVREYRYISPGMDSKKWSALATKASFIAAFMDTKSKVRSIESDALGEEDNGTASDILNSMSESLGDTRYTQKRDAENKIEQLEKQRTNFETRRRKARDDVKRYKEHVIPQLRLSIDNADTDSAVYAYDREVRPGFSIQIRNAATGEFQTFTDIDKAQSFLDGNYQAAAKNPEYANDFIRFRGFKVGVEKVKGTGGNLFTSDYQLTARSSKPDFKADRKAADENAKAEKEKAAKEGKKETKKKEIDWEKPEWGSLESLPSSDFGRGAYSANGTSLTSLRSVLSKIASNKEIKAKNLAKAEEDLVGYESQANAEWKDQPKLDAQKKRLKAIEDDLKENKDPAPEWFRTIAAVGNLVRYNGALYPIVGHSIPNGDTVTDYGIIVEDPTVGNEERIRIPASEARDENGVLLFQPEDLARNPRQRIVDEADDVNYTDNFERDVDKAFSDILEEVDPDDWEITSKGVRRKTTEAETGKQGVRWTEEIEGDEIVYSSPIKDGEPIGGANSFKSFTKRINKLEASVAESTEPEIQRSVGELVSETLKAFPGAKNISRNGQHLTFTMPNGTNIAVDIANQLFLSGEEAEQARKAHGKNADEPIRINGYTRTFDRDAAISLAQDGDRGTVFHESYHVAHNLVLTEKEKAAMEKHFAPIAKEQGRAVTEVMADAYRDWQLARKQRKGTLFGKLFQKIQDFAKKVLAVLTGTENVHNVMRKIAEGEVWSRDARNGNRKTDFLVTNPHLKSDTKIPVLDFNDLTALNVDDPGDRLKLQQQLIERFKNGKFTILNGPGIEATVQRIHNPDLDGVVRNDKGEVQYFTDRVTGDKRPLLKPAKSVNGLLHWVYGARKTKGNLYLRTVPERMKATSSDSAIEKLLNGAVYVEVHPDMAHGGTRGDFVEMYAAVKADASDKNPKAVYRYKIIAKKMTGGDMYQIKTIGLYDFFRQNDSNRRNDVRKLVEKDGTITAANLLKDVYDRNGQQYVDKEGNLVYDPNVTVETEPKVEASISSKVDEGLKKAEAYANRNMRTANEKTAEGRTAQIFKNATNKSVAQTAVSWLEEQKGKFYRDFVDKNDAFHKVDDQIEAITGKKLAENSKLYNKVQILKALISGAATTLIEGNEHSMSALRERIGSTVDAKKNPEKAKRVEQLKDKFNLVTMKDVMRTIEYKKMDAAHPDYLEKHGLNSWREAFGNYLGARRLLELMRIAEENNKPYTLPKNITAEDLQTTVKNAPKEFEDAAKKYYKLQENLLILMEDGGLINQEIHEFMNKTYHDYCPLMVDFSDTASFDKVLSRFVGDGNGIVNVNSMLKFVLEEGSERGLLSPLESTYKSISMLTSRAERNKVAAYFVQAVESDEDLKKAGILTRVKGKSDDPKNCIFTVLMNGEKVAYQTRQDLYGPIVGGDEPSGGLAFSLMKNTARTLRAGATSSPSFIVRNLIRDTIFAGVSSRNGFVPVIDSFKGMWALWNDPKLKGEFEATGVTAFNYYRSAEQAVDSLDQLAGGKFEIHSLGDFVKAFFKYAGAASDFVEAGTRMGEFMRARAAGKSMAEAALDAKDVTLDFSRSGEIGQKYNQIIPFFNACIQGGDKMIRLLADPKTRMHTARMLGLYIMVPSLLLWMWNKDEPWYEELDPNVKMGSWILPGGIRIPKPQEAGIIFGSGIEAFMDKMTDRDPKAMANWRKAAREAFLPNLIPTLFLPLMEWQANYSFFREKAIEGKRLQKLPVEQRYNNSTSELNKAIGSATGLSPVKLDNTVRGFLGTMGMFAWQLPDVFFESKNNLPSKKFKERTFVRDFVLNDMNQNRTQEEFYDLVSAAQQHHAGYGRKGKPSEATRAVNKALRDVSAKNKEIQQITNAKGMSPERKRQLIDQKRKVIHQIQKATLKKYRSKYDI